jgi:hypothetical protein
METGCDHQTPVPVIEIFKPENEDPEKADIIYTANTPHGAYSKLLGYSFVEAADDLEGSFSFSVENEEAGDGKTVFDLVPVRSIVKIYEGDLERPAFVGIVRRRRMGASMTSQGVKRTITFSGKSVVSCIAEYTVSLDVRIQGVSDAISKTRDLTARLSKKSLSIKNFMAETWQYFKDISESAGVVTTGIAEIINRHIGGGDSFISVLGKERELRYPVACAFFNAGNNTITDVWRNILPKPVYELFSRCDGGKPKIIARQVPYGDPENGNDDWGNLDLYVISPVSLVSYDLEQSDEDVYTAFASYVVGSAMDKSFYMAENQTGKDTTVVHCPEKQKIYGFKPLEIVFNGYDRQGNADDGETESLKTAVMALNKTASYWFSRQDDMYAGSVTVCTDFNEPETNPRVGCRAGFLGGEFYIERAAHSWNFGGTPMIKLSLSRGMVYDENGKMRDGTGGIMKNVGGSYREFAVKDGA